MRRFPGPTAVARRAAVMLSALLLGTGALPDAAVGAGHDALPATDMARPPEDTLLLFLQGERARAGAGPLIRRDLLDREATTLALDMATRGDFRPVPGDGRRLQERLAARFYIVMLDAALAARAGSDPLEALRLWLDRPEMAASLLDPAMADTGLAAAPNPAATGAHDAWIWLVILACPLRTPAEHPDSPRFGREPLTD